MNKNTAAFGLFFLILLSGCAGGVRGGDGPNEIPNTTEVPANGGIGGGIGTYFCQFKDTQTLCESDGCVWDPQGGCLSPLTSFCSSATTHDSCGGIYDCLWNKDKCVTNIPYNPFSFIQNDAVCIMMKDVDACSEAWSMCSWNNDSGKCGHSLTCYKINKESCDSRASCIWNKDVCVLNVPMNPLNPGGAGEVCRTLKTEQACDESWSFCRWSEEDGCDRGL